MPSRHASALPPSRLRRAVAVLAAGLVLLLSFSAVSPGLHAWLHDESADHPRHACTHAAAGEASDAPAEESHACAVTLFAHGVVHHAAALLTQPCEGILRAIDVRAFERLALAQPRYLHRPPQAPPAV